MSPPSRPLTLAIPKGRIQKALGPLLSRAGIDAAPLSDQNRKLVRPTKDGSLRYLFLKPDDVPTYVEYGAADLGVCGRDTLREKRFDVLAPIDLGIGLCRMVVAAPAKATIPEVPRIATKYPHIASEHFARRGIQAEIISVQGSVELAPLVGLSDAIVDLVESGATLRENGLAEREEVEEIGTQLIANRTAFKLRAQEIAPLLDRLRKAVAESGRA